MQPVGPNRAIAYNPQLNRAYDHVTTHVQPQNETIRREIAVRSHDWSEKLWMIVRANLVPYLF